MDIITRVSIFIVSVVVVFLAYSIYTNVSYDTRQPVSINSVQLIENNLHSTDTLIVEVNRNKVRGDCTLFSINRIRNSLGTIVDFSLDVQQGIIDTDNVIIREYPLPQTIIPGQYTLEVELNYLCPKNLTFKIDQPTIYFNVINND